MQQNGLLELEFKAKLFTYVQWVKIFISASIFTYSNFFLQLTDYTYFLPQMCMAIFLSSTLGLISIKYVDRNFKFTPYIISTLEFLIFLYYIYISTFAYNTLIFWLSGLIILTYFFTNFKFSILQLIVSFTFITLWPYSFHDKVDILYNYQENFDSSFKLSAYGFLIFIFLIFYFSERIKNLYLKTITKVNVQFKGEASFPLYNPDPIFEYTKKEHLTPKNSHAREFVLTASNIEIDRLMQYSLDTLVSGKKRKVRCMLSDQHYNVNLIPVDGKVNLYLTNITDLIHAQIELEKKEQYNRAIIDAMPGFVSWIDKDLNYLGVNDHICEFFNATESEFIGKKLGSVHSPKDDILHIIAKKLFADPYLDSINEEISYHHDGVDYWNFVNLKKYNNGDEAVLVSVDITNLKKAEEQIIQEQKKAEASAKLAAFGEMSAGIAHEINNPLAIIKGSIQRINKLRSKDQLTDEKFHDMIERCHYGIDRVTKIIAGMKNLSRDGQNDAFESVLLSDIIDDSLVLLSKKCEVNNIELFISNYDNSIELVCQRVQISQVIVILINNSIDAIKETKSKWIKIQVDLKDENLILSVIDSGSGIDKGVSENIFKPFFTTKKVGKGTGLGLSLASKIIKSHRGEFSLDSDCINTKFDLIIPLKPTDNS